VFTACNSSASRENKADSLGKRQIVSARKVGTLPKKSKGIEEGY